MRQPPTDTEISIRVREVAEVGSGDVAASVELLTTLAPRALAAMYLSADEDFVQTVRGGTDGRLVPEGANLRYAAVVALGLSRVDEVTRQAVLAGGDVRDLVAAVVRRAREVSDPGAVALAAWASAEVSGEDAVHLLDRLVAMASRGAPGPTVDYAWTLTALLASSPSVARRAAARVIAARLMDSQSPGGVFPHHLPGRALGRHRAHVACFADQVYPIQALARFHAVERDNGALAAADECAERICELQGQHGQWWWHYDVRTGHVLEGYPVYSVHQHGMAPMALLELKEAGGTDHRASVARGMAWMTSHPETTATLLDERTGAVWRKIGRHEPRKAVRTARALSTSVSPRLRLGALDRIFPPGRIDRECRPYELGWLLYAWGTDASRSPATPKRSPGRRTRDMGERHGDTAPC